MAPLGTAALAALVLCAGSALGKWREPAASPLLNGSFIGGTTGPWKQVTAQWYTNQSDCEAGTGGQQPVPARWLVPSIGSTCVKPQTSQDDGDQNIPYGRWWSVRQMSSAAIEMDVYNTSDCAGQASRLIVKPGDCVDATGIDLGQKTTTLGPWVKLSAPAEMPGGFQVVEYVDVGVSMRPDTCDDGTVPIFRQDVIQFWRPTNGALQMCLTVALKVGGTKVVPEQARTVVLGCLGYGGRAVWAEVANCSDTSASTSRFTLFNKTCHQARFVENGDFPLVDPKLSAADIVRLGMQGAPLVNPPIRRGAHLSCFGSALNTAGPGWWIPSDKLAPLVAQARAEVGDTPSSPPTPKTNTAEQLLPPLATLVLAASMLF
jgi:hypothetical protein